MSTPATLEQAQKLLALVSQAKATNPQMQNLVANGDLIKYLLACPDLTKVNRTDFRALLHPPAASVAWTPVEEYADRIAARNDLCHWGLSSKQITEFGASLKPHLGELQPSGLLLWLGHTLKYNWEQVVAWLSDEIEALGGFLPVFIRSDLVAFWPGFEMDGPARLRPVWLDMATTWHPSEGLIPAEVRMNRGLDLAGLELAWTLALSPQILLAIDGRMFPAMLAAGLMVDSTGVPNFDHGAVDPFVGCVESGSRMTRQAVVAVKYY